MKTLEQLKNKLHTTLLLYNLYSIPRPSLYFLRSLNLLRDRQAKMSSGGEKKFIVISSVCSQNTNFKLVSDQTITIWDSTLQLAHPNNKSCQLKKKNNSKQLIHLLSAFLFTHHWETYRTLDHYGNIHLYSALVNHLDAADLLGRFPSMASFFFLQSVQR